MCEKTMETITFVSDFQNALQDWTICGTACDGKWAVEDDALIFHTITEYPKGRGFLSTAKRFRRISRVELEFFAAEVDAGETDIWIRGFDYTSMGRLIKREDGSLSVQYMRMNSVARTGMVPMLQLELPRKNMVKWGQWNRYCMQIQGQTFTLYLNGEQILTYEDPECPREAPVCIHLKVSVDGAGFRNVVVEAEALLPPQEEAKEIVAPGAYRAQMTMDRSKPFGFLEEAGEEHWTMSLWNGAPVYSTPAGDGLRMTWLHGFEKDGEVCAQLVCPESAQEGSCGIFARFGVDGCYLRGGYDFEKKVWFLASCLGVQYQKQFFASSTVDPMVSGRQYELKLVYEQQSAKLYVDGTLAVIAERLGNTSYGRMGLFACKTAVHARSFACTLPNGSKITDGILEKTVTPNEVCSHMEIERLDENTIYGQFLGQRFISYDLGVHFEPAPAKYDQTGYDGYPSIHKRYSDGKFIQIRGDRGFSVEESEDLQNWTHLTRLLPDERIYDEKGRFLALIHVSSITEMPMPDGSTRIFLPIAFRNYIRDNIAGHYTDVFYTDDGGRTWKESEKNVRDLPNFPVWDGNMSWCESKIIRCADGRLRMLCSRTLATCMYYADSFDDGKTWTEYGELPELETPTTSFAICPDPLNPGSYLMVYVNNVSHFRSTIFPRTRLTLVRTDGLKYEKLLDLERFSTSENPTEGLPELYQLLDPCINVFEDYIFVAYGRSDDDGGPENPHHNAQRIRFVRIDRKVTGI